MRQSRGRLPPPPGLVCSCNVGCSGCGLGSAQRRLTTDCDGHNVRWAQRAGPVELALFQSDPDFPERLEQWLNALLREYQDCILDLDQDMAQLWGRLRVPHPENALDKQIAATALIHDLTVVTRNVSDFQSSGVQLINPWAD